MTIVMRVLNQKKEAQAKTRFNEVGNKPAKPKPFSLGLTFEGRVKLNAMAGDWPLEGFVRHCQRKPAVKRPALRLA